MNIQEVDERKKKLALYYREYYEKMKLNEDYVIKKREASRKYKQKKKLEKIANAKDSDEPVTFVRIPKTNGRPRIY